MDIHHLIKMANDIGAFFESEPDRAVASRSIADHLKSFWERRMLNQILSHVENQEGAGLSELVLNALRQHEQRLRS